MRRLLHGLPRAGGGQGQARGQGKGRGEGQARGQGQSRREGQGRGDANKREDEDRSDEEVLAEEGKEEGTKTRWLLAKNIIMAFRNRNKVTF